jgi:hypothetical protein
MIEEGRGMGRIGRAALAVAILAAMFSTQAARADQTLDCTHAGSVWIGPTIFPPIACQAQLQAGRYRFTLDWVRGTTGFVVLGAGDDTSTATYFNMRVDLGLVTHYETESGEQYPPAKPPLRGPVTGRFVLTSSGTILLTVFPEQISAPTQAVVVPAGTFRLRVYRVG